MTTPLSQFPKPEASQYEGQRKLYLVPIFTLSPAAPEEGQTLLEQYWSEVRDHVGNLERSLGPVSHVFHELVSDAGDESMRLIEVLNGKGYPFIHAMCQSRAKLQAAEDRALVEENTDWQRCLSVGLVSEKVMSTALNGYTESLKKRFEHIGSRIDETLGDGEAGILFVSGDHGIQFPPNVQVFYVAPPALDALKRWIGSQSQAAAQAHSNEDADGADEQAEDDAGETAQ